MTSIEKGSCRQRKSVGIGLGHSVVFERIWAQFDFSAGRVEPAFCRFSDTVGRSRAARRELSIRGI